MVDGSEGQALYHSGPYPSVLPPTPYLHSCSFYGIMDSGGVTHPAIQIGCGPAPGE